MLADGRRSAKPCSRSITPCTGIVLARAGAAAASRRTGIPGAQNWKLDAFLLAFDQDAHYDSPNFLWFRARYPRFVYVDRIVVAIAARGRGYARRLYDDLFEHAAAAGHDRVVCEVNTQPPNPASDAFHAALGFVEVGTASVHDGSQNGAISCCASSRVYAALAGGSASTE